MSERILKIPSSTPYFLQCFQDETGMMTLVESKLLSDKHFQVNENHNHYFNNFLEGKKDFAQLPVRFQLRTLKLYQQHFNFTHKITLSKLNTTKYFY